MCVYMCLCVCICERKTETEKGRDTESERQTDIYLCKGRDGRIKKRKKRFHLYGYRAGLGVGHTDSSLPALSLGNLEVSTAVANRERIGLVSPYCSLKTSVS
jgi:hypothetical protein